MNLQQLEYFKIIAETENFTTASKQLSVTQPALSKSISNLEEELGVPLFIKNGRNIKLSEYGKLFLAHATGALNEIESGVNELQKLLQADSATIAIGTTSNIGIHFIPSIISQFIMENPDTNFQFNYEPVESMLKGLENHTLDFCFYDHLPAQELSSDLISIPIRNVDYVLIVPKNHPLAGEEEVSLRDLKSESFVSSCKLTKDQLVFFEKMLGYRPNIVIQPSESNMVEGLVAAGAGIAIVSDTPLMNTNVFSKVKLKEKTCSRTIYMAWNKTTRISASATSFLSYIKQSQYKDSSN